MWAYFSQSTIFNTYPSYSPLTSIDTSYHEDNRNLLIRPCGEFSTPNKVRDILGVMNSLEEVEEGSINSKDATSLQTYL